MAKSLLRGNVTLDIPESFKDRELSLLLDSHQASSEWLINQGQEEEIFLGVWCVEC